MAYSKASKSYDCKRVMSIVRLVETHWVRRGLFHFGVLACFRISKLIGVTESRSWSSYDGSINDFETRPLNMREFLIALFLLFSFQVGSAQMLEPLGFGTDGLDAQLAEIESLNDSEEVPSSSGLSLFLGIGLALGGALGFVGGVSVGRTCQAAPLEDENEESDFGKTEGFSRLTSIEAVTIYLMTLGPEASEAIAAVLDSATLEKVAEQSMRVPVVSSEVAVPIQRYLAHRLNVSVLDLEELLTADPTVVADELEAWIQL